MRGKHHFFVFWPNWLDKLEFFMISLHVPASVQRWQNFFRFYSPLPIWVTNVNIPPNRHSMALFSGQYLARFKFWRFLPSVLLCSIDKTFFVFIPRCQYGYQMSIYPLTDIQWRYFQVNIWLGSNFGDFCLLCFCAALTKLFSFLFPVANMGIKCQYTP